MPYPYRISVEFTNDQGARERTHEVDGSHKFFIDNAKHQEHSTVEVVCSGPTSDAPISGILFKLNP